MTTTAVDRRPFSEAEFADRVLVDRVSLQMSEKLTYDEWIQLGRSLTEVGDSMAWWVGDWIEQGTTVYGGKYELALEVMALDPQTLKNYALVARRFNVPARRRESLSFTHHAYVASLDPDEADGWLDRAEAADWSARELLEQLRAARKVLAQVQNGDTRITLEQLKITVPADRAEKWKLAAIRDGVQFDEWCARTLDAAAA